MTRGALYYHFKDKAGLFRAVHRETDESLIETIAQIMEKAEGDEWQRAIVGSRAFLTLCSTPGIRRILYIDGPVVLASDLPAPVGLGLIQQQTQLLMHLGYIAEQPVEPLSQLIFGSFIQGALYIPRRNRARSAEVVKRAADQALTTRAPTLRTRRAAHHGQPGSHRPSVLGNASISDTLIVCVSD